MIADVFHGDANRDFVEVLKSWGQCINKQVGPGTTRRYACSLDQIRPWLDGKKLNEIDSRLVAEIVRSRSAAGVTNATIKRDLVALSSVINYAIDQGWRDDNPVLPRMRRIKERREPIILPHRAHVDLVIGRCPGMIADVVRVAITTGARQDELLKARREQIDHDRRQMTLIGKGRRVRVISLDPYGGYDLMCSLPVYAYKPLLFWHADGKGYKNFASRFAAIVQRTAKWARENSVDFRPFRFHDLRHLHAVTWLKDGRSIYDLKNRLLEITSELFVLLPEIPKWSPAGPSRDREPHIPQCWRFLQADLSQPISLIQPRRSLSRGSNVWPFHRQSDVGRTSRALSADDEFAATQLRPR